jgi:hypothetical protein
LFPFSLRGKAKDWLLSLPKNSIDAWVKCKDAFIRKYYPPAKDFISKQTAFNKSVEEKLGKIDILGSKVDSLALDVRIDENVRMLA